MTDEEAAYLSRRQITPLRAALGRLRFWKRQPVEAAADPLLLALEMVQAAAKARSSADAVASVVAILSRTDERLTPLAAVHLAVFLGQPSPSARRTTPAETAAWVDNLVMQLAFDGLVDPLRDLPFGSEG